MVLKWWTLSSDTGDKTLHGHSSSSSNMYIYTGGGLEMAGHLVVMLVGSSVVTQRQRLCMVIFFQSPEKKLSELVVILRKWS